MSTRLQVMVTIDGCSFTADRGERGVDVSSVTVRFIPDGHGQLEPSGVSGSGREYDENDELGSRRLVSLAWLDLPSGVRSEAFAQATAAVREVCP